MTWVDWLSLAQPLIHYAFRPACDCHCHLDSTVELGALRLLEKQLDRCGPEHLAGVVPASSPSWWGLTAAFVLGLALGGAAARCGRTAVGLVFASVRSPPPPTLGRPSVVFAVTPKTKASP